MRTPVPPSSRAAVTTRGLSLARIAQAAGVISAPFRDSPQFESEPLGGQLGCRVVIKVETLNPIRSFKARGAQFLMSELTGCPHLVCATAGNFGQGMAYAARERRLPLTVFTSVGASPMKIERMRAMGADVRTVGNNADDTHAAARVFATESGALLVEDGRDPAIAEGAGTIGVELLRWPEAFDAVILPLGDGALLGGVARWIKEHSPTTRTIGVCAAGSPAMERSWRSKHPQSVPPTTIADGIAIQTPFAEAVANLVELVDNILFVEDSTLVAAMRLVHRELGVVLEPSGAAGIAALMTHPAHFRGKLTATVLTGGNLTLEQMQMWLGG